MSVLRAGAVRRGIGLCFVAWLLVVSGAGRLWAQANVLFTESFSTDGDGDRYTLSNRGYVPVAGRLPNGFEHSFSLPGIEPGGAFTFPARRIALPWSGTVNGSEYSPTALATMDSAIQWAGSGATGLDIAFLAKDGATPTTLDPGDQFLYNRLVSQGFNVQVADANSFTQGLVSNSDLLLLSDTVSTAGLYRQVNLRNIDIPVVNYNPQLASDLLLTRSAGGIAPSQQVQIRDASHPALPSGLVNNQNIGWTTSPQSLPTFGMVQPGVSTLATYNSKFATSVDRLAVVDAMIGGQAASNKFTEQATDADYYDSGNSGTWGINSPIPGGGGDDYAIVATGQFTVPASGKYMFGLGNDDGGRLRIDGQDLIVDDALHGFGYRVGQTQLTAGNHTLEWVGFERGGDAGFELAVSPTPDQTAVDDVLWEPLSTTSALGGPKLTSPMNVTAHYLDVANSPLVSSDQTAIVAVDGGVTIDVQRSPFRTTTGEYLFAKDTNAGGLPNPAEPRVITFDPVNLAGVADPRLTVSLAANVAAWNREDHFVIKVNGQPLVTFSPDELGSLNDGSNLLSASFKNLTYALPKGLAQAEISMEILAPDGDQLIGIDEVRVSNGPIVGLPVYQSPSPTSFQQGIRGYTGTVDTEIWQSRPNDGHPNIQDPAEIVEALSLDPQTNQDGGPVEVLIRFDRIFGSGAGQIPLDRKIKSARLSFEVFGDGDQLNLHRLLKPFKPTDTWNSLNGGIQADGVEASATPESTSGGFVNFGQVVFDVTDSLKAFQANPATNFGWAILPTGGDDVNVLSSEVVLVANSQEQLTPLLEYELYSLVLGDFDSDGDVDSDDLLDFLVNWTGSDYPAADKTWDDGDSDEDGDVDSADTLVFLSNWTGALSAESVASVPESAGLSLWLLALLGTARQIRRRSSWASNR
ncbi:MAG: PA14 domain-containing protein [Pirellulales bacterium]